MFPPVFSTIFLTRCALKSSMEKNLFSRSANAIAGCWRNEFIVKQIVFSIFSIFSFALSQLTDQLSDQCQNENQEVHL